MYCSTDDAYRKAGLTVDEVSVDDVIETIKESELDVDRTTNTTFWSIEHDSTVTSATNTTVTDTTAEFGSNDELKGDYVWIYSGTGINQLLEIKSHTNTEITVEENWAMNPINGDEYRVVHSARDPRKTEYRDGDATQDLFTNQYPIRRLVSVTIDGTSVTTSNIDVYDQEGQLYLGGAAEVKNWTNIRAKKNVIVYWYGVYKVPREAQKLCALYTARSMLNEQMGGTHNIPSTYSLPEGSVTIGQAYVNIKGTLDKVEKQILNAEKKIRKYPFFG